MESKKGQDFIALLVFIGIIIFIIFCLLYALPIKFYKTLEDGTHTGQVTAIEKEGIIWKTYNVYFKSDAQSSQEDTYCVIDENVKNDLIKYQESKTTITIMFEDYFIVGYPLCGETPIIVGVKEKTR